MSAASQRFYAARELNVNRLCAGCMSPVPVRERLCRSCIAWHELGVAIARFTRFQSHAQADALPTVDA